MKITKNDMVQFRYMLKVLLLHKAQDSASLGRIALYHKFINDMEN